MNKEREDEISRLREEVTREAIEFIESHRSDYFTVFTAWVNANEKAQRLKHLEALQASSSS